MKKQKKIIALALASMLLLGTVACGESETAKASPIKRSDKEFILTCYSTPHHENTGGSVPYGKHPDQNTEEHWQNIADCGFTHAQPTFDATYEQALATLKAAEKAGIKVLVMDHLSDGINQTIRRNEGKSYADVMAIIKSNETALKARIEEYKKYTSFAGIQAIDEPSEDHYDGIAAAQDWWYENYPEYEFYVNLFPSYSSYNQLFGEDSGNGYKYVDYVDMFVERTNPAFLSYDYYPFIRSGFGATIRTTYLADLEIYAEAAKKYKIPFGCYQLCVPHLSYTEPSTYREYAWQVYTALAYGCSRFQTFKYWAYMVGEVNSQNLGNGLVGRDGELMPLYYAVQEVNQELKALQSLYFNFEWEGTMTLGASGGGGYATLQHPMKSLYGVSDVKSTEDAIVGQFKDKEGNYAYMVTNFTSPYVNKSTTVTMKFNNVSKVLIAKKGREVVQTLKGNTLTMTVGSGEGYFVIPIQ